MRENIKKLVELGQIPDYDNSTEEILEQYGALIDSIEKPVTDEEAMALINLFSPDNAGGINWDIIHLVETSPNWPLQSFLIEHVDLEDVQTLIQRAKNSGLWK